MTILTRVKTGPLGQRLRRVVQLQRTRGTARAGYAILRRLLAWPVLRQSLHLCAIDFWRLQLSADSWSPPRTSSLFTVRWAEPADLEELAQYFGSRERVKARIASGDRCVVAISQAKIGAAVWLGIGPSQFVEDWDDLRCVFRYPAGIAWTYDGKGTKLGAWGTMMKLLPGLLRHENVSEIATIIDCNNWQSMDAHRSLGYESAGVLLHVRVLGVPLRLFKPQGKRWRRVPPAIDRVKFVTKPPQC